MDQGRHGRVGRGAPGRVTGALAALLLAALLASPATAGERFGLVGAVDRSANTMTIDGQVFAVDDETEMRDRDGNALSLASFPAPGELEAVAVYYEAEGGRLRSVRITDLPQ